MNAYFSRKCFGSQRFPTRVFLALLTLMFCHCAIVRADEDDNTIIEWQNRVNNDANETWFLVDDTLKVAAVAKIKNTFSTLR